MIEQLFSSNGVRAIVNILWYSDMGYNTSLFWIFLIGFISVYVLLWNATVRKYWILLGSLIFYIWNGVGAFIIVLGTAIVVFITSRRIENIYVDYDKKKEGLKPKEQVVLFSTYKKKAKKYLWIAFFAVIGLWVYVKAMRLLDASIIEELSSISWGLAVIVPLGISYYTLSSVGYLLDVYWKKGKAEHKFLDLLSVMIYFPHIVQGPISKYSKILEQMKTLSRPKYEQVCYGLQLMLWGYIKKIIIADRLSLYTTTVFNDPFSFAGVEIIIAVLLNVAQLYADFSGCMDIVRGISQVLGIELEPNFRQPFFAKSAQEFWSRWHMTLGGWTKEYIYMPIAMNPKFMKYTRTMKKEGKAWRSSFLKAFCPLATVWIFTGIWHGTGIDYMMWGMYWCTLMTLSKELQPIADKWIDKYTIQTDRTSYLVWRMVRTTLFFAVGRMITVTGYTTGVWILIKQIFSEHRVWTLFDGSLYSYGLDQKDFYVALIGMGIMLAVDILHERGMKLRTAIAEQGVIVRWAIYYVAIMSVVLLGMYGPSFDASSFIYGAF